MTTFEHARKRFMEVVTNSYSAFYKNLYAGKIAVHEEFPRNREDWETIPLLSKQDIMDVAFDMRIFIPRHRVDVVRITSGTTSSGVLTIPRNNLRPIPEFRRMKDCAAVLSFFYPHHLHGFFENDSPRVIGGDAARMDASARLAADAGVDILQGMPSLVLAFAPTLKRHYDAVHIKWLQLTAERTTVFQAEALHTAYPNARFMIGYASSEMQGWAAASPEKESVEYPFAVQSRPDYFFELIDDEGHPIHEAGIVGELVASALHTEHAFPLIRYRTGDRAIMHEQREDGSCLFTLVGRVEGDRIRFAGGQFLAEEIERAIHVQGAGVRDFEADVREVHVDGILVPQLQIALVLSENEHVNIDTDIIAEALSKEIRVSEGRTYGEAVAHRLCAPLTVHIKKESLIAGKKHRRLIDARIE